MKQKIVTFGELLLRFSKRGHRRLTQDEIILGNYGGSEANVAVSLATLGETVEYVTRLPDNLIGRAAQMRLREMGVGTSHVLFGGERIGTYYFEEAAAMRNSGVIYDRKGSSFYSLCPGMINWRDILADATIFHASGITGAISHEAAEATFEALHLANEMGKLISFDINHRKNLWRYPNADARQTLSQMLEYADVVFADVIEYEFITNHAPIPFTATSADYEIDMAPYEEWFRDIHARFPRCQRWLMGIRNQVSASHHTLTALLWSRGRLLKSRVFDIPDIADPIGVGDAFMAALLHALNVFPGDDQMALDYALAAAALKNSIVGDFNLATDEDIRCALEL